MKLLDRLRTRPEWESDDSAVRADAVRTLPPDDQELLIHIAAEDEAPAVRREAVWRVTELPALCALLRAESDADVRAATAEALRGLLLDATDDKAAVAALDLLEALDLVAVAREAHVPAVASAALARLTADKHLVAVATRASSPDVAAAALARLDAADALQDVAVKAEVRAVALAAFERLSAAVPDSLRLATIARRAKQKVVARRARALLAEREAELAATAPEAPSAPAAPPPVLPRPDTAPVAEFEAERAEQAQREQRRRELLAAARGLCEAVEHLPGSGAAEELPRLREEWSALSWSQPGAPPPDAAAALHERFEQALAGCEDRRRQWAADQDCLQRLEALVVEMEQADPAADDAARAQAWRDIVAELEGRTLLRRESRERLDGLERRKRQVDARRRAAAAAARAEAEREAQKDLQQFERLCAVVEELLKTETVELPEAERRLRAVRQALDQLRETDPSLSPTARRARAPVLRRMQQIQTVLLARVRELRENANWQRWANLGVRETLCARLESLQDEADPAKVAGGYRDIMREWRRTADVPQDRDEPLRARFEAAHAVVYPRLQEHREAQDASRKENLQRRLAMIEEAERLAGSTAWVKAAERLAALQKEWQAMGPVPRAQHKETWDRFRAACNAFFQRRKADLAERKQEWKRNLERKEALIARVEALAEPEDPAAAGAQVREAQAEWKTIGPVQRKRSDAVWERFRAACNAVSSRIEAAEHAAMADRVAVREALCSEMEALRPAGETVGDPPADLAATVGALRQRWRQAPEVPPIIRRRLAGRFGQGLQQVCTAWPDVFRGSDLDSDHQLRRLQELCARAESLAGDQAASGTSPAEILATRWRDALASNLMGGRVDEAARRRSVMVELRQLQAERRKLGQVPGPAAQRLAQRFREACDRAYKASARPA